MESVAFLLILSIHSQKGVELSDNLKLTALDSNKLKILGRCKKQKLKPRSRVSPQYTERIPDPEHYFLPRDEGIIVEQHPHSGAEREERPVVAECNDRSSGCEIYRSNGICLHGRYRQLMLAHCKRSCGLCGQSVEGTELNDLIGGR